VAFPLEVPAYAINELKGMNLDYTKPYFNMSMAACRAAGARGGHRSGLNRRLRRPAQPPFPNASHPEPVLETAHQANMFLDERFPHLRNGWDRTARRPAA
jgi:hypothetical protein